MRSGDPTLAVELGLAGRARLARLALALGPALLSLIAHAGLVALGAGLASPPQPPKLHAFPASAAAVGEQQTSALLGERRRQLVASARAARAQGELSLGEFLLNANALDAQAEGLAFDLPARRAEYRARVEALSRALQDTPPEQAVAEVFGDLAYTGTPGGRMADTLATRRGSCEPVSQLVAAALFDAGLGERTTLRFYGATIAGATHVTAVLAGGPASPGALVDLMTGMPPAPGGATFRADGLIDAYARAHGLEPRELASARREGGAVGSARQGGVLEGGSLGPTRTLSLGYPENHDAFAGSLPLFAERAIAAAPASGLAARVEPPPCATYVAMAWLDLPSVTAWAPSGAVEATLVRAPTALELERLSTRVQELELAPEAEGLADRLLRRACLAALYDHAGLAFSLSGQGEVAARAGVEAKRVRAEAAADLAALEALPPAARLAELRALDQAALGRGWVLLFLGAEGLVRQIAGDEQRGFGRATALAALLVSPVTRAETARSMETVPLADQLDVMHELSHAHDHARPWAATYALDLSAAPELARGAFPRAFAVFRAVAWRLWDAARPPEEIVAALDRESSERGLEEPVRRAIALYLLKQVTRLYGPREGGAAAIERTVEALAAHGLPGPEELLEAADLSLSERASVARLAGRGSR